MQRVDKPNVLTMRRWVAVVGAGLSLALIPAITAVAAPAPSPTPEASQPAVKPGGISLQLGALALNIPLSLNIGGILQIGSGGETSTPPTSPPPSSSGGSTTPPAPPTTTHHQSSPPATHQRSTSAGPPPTSPASNQGGGFPPPNSQPAASSSSSHPATHSPTTSAPTSKDTKGTGSLVLTQRLLGNSGEVMIAALLAATALAVIAFARLGGVRRGRGTRQH